MDKSEETIRKLSDKAFAEHQVTEVMRHGVYRQWKCAKPKSNTYGFHITTFPGNLVLTGDLGTLIVAREYDMLPWCRGSVDSTDYFAEKVAKEILTREFSHDRLREWIGEEIMDPNTLDSHLELLQEALDEGIENDGPDYFYRTLNDVWQGNDPPNWTDWKPQFLWQRDAIRWFVTHHDEPEIE